MITARTPQTSALPSQLGTAAPDPQHAVFEQAAAQLRPAWTHVWQAASAETSGLREPAGAVRQASLDYSFDPNDQREVERYVATLERDFRMQKPRLLRWVAILALTGIGLLWGLSTSAASDPRPSHSATLP